MIPGQYETLPPVIVKGRRPVLMGRNWLKELHLNWKSAAVVSCDMLERHGVQVKLLKFFQFFQSSEYLGHQVDKEGLHPTEENVAAIINAPEPTTVNKLKSF